MWGSGGHTWGTLTTILDAVDFPPWKKLDAESTPDNGNGEPIARVGHSRLTSSCPKFESPAARLPSPACTRGTQHGIQRAICTQRGTQRGTAGLVITQRCGTPPRSGIGLPTRSGFSSTDRVRTRELDFGQRPFQHWPPRRSPMHFRLSSCPSRIMLQAGRLLIVPTECAQRGQPSRPTR